MNYANMIEEKKLKKGFIIATLMSTVAGTFLTGLNLYDSISERRNQNKRDKGQDQRIKEIEKRLGEDDNAKNDRRKSGNDLRDSLEYSGPMVRREYDQHFARMGPKFAQGDIIAQTQLQSQIITLQGTVIKLLEEALLTGRTPDISVLYNASEFARESSIRALRDQYQRLLQAAPVRRPIGPIRRISSTPELRDESESGGSQQKALTFNKAGPLFCPYAVELQQTNRPLDEVFDEGGTRTCPVCDGIIAIEADRSWRMEKEVVRDRVSKGLHEKEIVELVEVRTYMLTNRFLVKCHREGVGYACYLCFRHRQSDTLCKGMRRLVDHVVENHTIGEYETDPDIRDVSALYQ